MQKCGRNCVGDYGIEKCGIHCITTGSFPKISKLVIIFWFKISI